MGWGTRVVTLAAAGSAAVLLAATGGVAQAVPTSSGIPGVMASTGDSITRAYDLNGSYFLRDAPAYSWSTGASLSTTITLNGVKKTGKSQYLHLRASNSALTAYNDAKTGAKMTNLAGQLTTAASQHPDYVTILMGANDACASSVTAMTSVTDFTNQLSTALTSFRSAAPTSRIFISSIPDVTALYTLLSGNASARSTWSLFKICPSALLGTSADRTAVRNRIIAFNSALQQACASITPPAARTSAPTTAERCSPPRSPPPTCRPSTTSTRA
jgi:hypothetical protein